MRHWQGFLIFVWFTILGFIMIIVGLYFKSLLSPCPKRRLWQSYRVTFGSRSGKTWFDAKNGGLCGLPGRQDPYHLSSFRIWSCVLETHHWWQNFLKRHFDKPSLPSFSRFRNRKLAKSPQLSNRFTTKSFLSLQGRKRKLSASQPIVDKLIFVKPTLKMQPSKAKAIS